MGRAKLLLLAAILCSFVGVTGWITWHYDQAYTLATRHTQLSAWALAQLELELHEFESAVDYYRNGRLDQERLNEAYDLAWNRLDVFLTGKEAKTIRQRFGAETLLHELFYQLQQYEPLITSPHLKPQDLEPLHQMLESMLPKVRNLMVLNFTGPSAMRDNAALEQSKAQNFVILGCLLLLGLVMVVLLLLEARRQHFLIWHDALTRLPNRAAFIQRLRQQCAHQQQVVLCLLDLNRFKEVNDSLGHSAGDQLLLKVADKLRQSLPEGVWLARIGSDEFALLMSGQKSEASWFAYSKRVRTGLERLLYRADPAHRVSVSVGISQYPHPATNADELLLFADLALLHARQDGQQHYRIFNRPMLNQYQRRRRLVTDLRAQLALGAQSQLFLCYQPQIPRQPAGRLGAEILIRWQHPELGFIPPPEIVDAAEENGMGAPLAAWIFQSMNRDLDSFPLPLVRQLDLAINLSTSLFHRGLPEQTLNWLSDGPLLPRQLVYELTETIALDDLALSQRVFAELRRNGIRIALDDFGTGWSSFAYLKDLKFDKLKIDKSFIQKMDSDARQALFVQAITELCHRLDICVVAEGVETELELSEVLRLAVDEIQGYYFARPLPAATFCQFAERQLQQPVWHP